MLLVSLCSRKFQPNFLVRVHYSSYFCYLHSLWLFNFLIEQIVQNIFYSIGHNLFFSWIIISRFSVLFMWSVESKICIFFTDSFPALSVCFKSTCKALPVSEWLSVFSDPSRRPVLTDGFSAYGKGCEIRYPYKFFAVLVKFHFISFSNSVPNTHSSRN